MDVELRAELLRRMDADQAARHAYAAAREGGTADWAPVAAVDDANREFLAPLIDRHGWLGSDLVGTDGARACWLLVQHAPAADQARWLPLMEAAVGGGRAAPIDLAYLLDRVAMHAGRRQTYGTQHLGYGTAPARLWPVRDLAAVNQRRERLGLPLLDADTLADVWTADELAEHGRRLAPSEA